MNLNELFNKTRNPFVVEKPSFGRQALTKAE
jgi:hypothetical protein